MNNQDAKTIIHKEVVFLIILAAISLFCSWGSFLLPFNIEAEDSKNAYQYFSAEKYCNPLMLCSLLCLGVCSFICLFSFWEIDHCLKRKKVLSGLIIYLLQSFFYTVFSFTATNYTLNLAPCSLAVAIILLFVCDCIFDKTDTLLKSK